MKKHMLGLAKIWLKQISKQATYLENSKMKNYILDNGCANFVSVLRMKLRPPWVTLPVRLLWVIVNTLCKTGFYLELVKFILDYVGLYFFLFSHTFHPDCSFCSLHSSQFAPHFGSPPEPLTLYFPSGNSRSPGAVS